MDIRAGNYCCSTDQEPIVYIKNQYSKSSLSSSLVISTTKQPTESFAKVSILQVLFQQVIATTHQTQSPMTALTSKSQNRISSGKFTRELNKKSLLNQSPIYTKHAWSMLPIFNPTLMSMLHSHSCLMFYSRPPCIFHMP